MSILVIFEFIPVPVFAKASLDTILYRDKFISCVFLSTLQGVVSVMTRCVLIYEPAHKMLVPIAVSSNEGSDEPVHVQRLARAFAARLHKGWI